MTALPEDMSVAIDELESAIADIESRLESTRAERDEAKGRQVELEIENANLRRELAVARERQAAIAISTDGDSDIANLRRELALAREQQNAGAEILGAIANTQGNAEHALQRIAETTRKFFKAASVTLRIAEGDRWVQTVRVGASSHLTGAQPTSDSTTSGTNLPATIYRECRQIHIPDLDNIDPSMTDWPVTSAREAGIRSICGSPLRRGDGAIGTLIVYRDRLQPFTDDELALQQSFADQAVIAIENARLFNETQQALERQTATADILKVIASSPSDVQPVFQAIAESAKRLLDGFTATVLHFRGDQLHLVAFTPTSPEADQGLQASFPQPVADFHIFSMVRDGATIHFPDTEAEGVPEMNRDLGRLRGFRSVLFIPLMNRGEAVGILSVTRTEPGAFAEHHVQLLQTFADQAVIAIENARLFNETQEALERQTATADILKVIASSPSDTTPVFAAIANSAKRLLGGFSTAVFRLVDRTVHVAAFTPVSPPADAALRADFPKPVDEFEPLQLTANGEPFDVPDTERSPHAPIREIARLHGFRSMLFVPLMNGGMPIGMISVTRGEPGAFVPHHVQLLQTFADQAVIAIENTRLFNETKEALERQTATAEILKVIASSPSDVQPVFDAIAHSANRLIGGFSTAVFRYQEGRIHLAAFTPTDASGDAVLQSSFPVPLEQFPPYQLTLSETPAELPDTETEPAARDIARARGYRSMLFAPLMNDGAAVGIITVTRAAPGPFGEQHTRLLQMFADQAVIAIKNVGLFNEVKEALERQTATADILKVIASSPSDTTPVFEAIASSANRLLGGFSTAVFRFSDGAAHLTAFTPTNPAADELLRMSFPMPVEQFEPFRLAQDGKPVPIPDTEAMPNPEVREIAQRRGFRSMLFVPLMSAGVPIGIISVTRSETGTFAVHHVDLLQTFADQAVIAIENTRLFNEVQARTHDLEESLQQQTATADVLKVISRSAFDLKTVLDTLIETAVRLGGSQRGGIFFCDGDLLRLQSYFGFPDEQVALLRDKPLKIGMATMAGRPALLGETVHIPDILEDKDFTNHAGQAVGRFRAFLGVPLKRDGTIFGVLAMNRPEPGPFTQRQIELVQTFADQAVIAIENVRLFDEVQARTEELSESLQQQTAVGDVLKTISRSTFDLQPVLDTLVNTAAILCDADMAFIMRRVGDEYRAGAAVGYTEAYIEFLSNHPLAVDRGTVTGRAVMERRPVQILDVAADPEYTLRDAQTLADQRTTLGVPLLREDEPIGVIVLARSRVEAFTQKQIDLVATFADQAVIAIENVRLFDELRQRTGDLSEALTHQTGSSNILKVIASSPTDVEPALKAIVESACELCDANDAAVLLREGDDLYFRAHHGPIAIDVEKWPIARDWASGRAVVDRATVHIPDIFSEDARDFAAARKLSEHTRGIGVRSVLSVPLLSEGDAIGAILLRRSEAQAFTDKQIALLQTFADQAVIAIGNVRLFEQVQERTRDLSEALTYQTGSSNILRVIASSPTDVNPVLKAIVESACELCEADDALVALTDGNDLTFQAQHGSIPVVWERQPVSRELPSGKAVLDRKAVHVHDLLAPEGEEFPTARELASRTNVRTVLSVPLLREDESIGVIALRRTDVRPFTDKQIALLQTFADQAVIAIGNVRLFEQVQERTRDLSKSLDDLRTAQDRLVQTEKLASLGQLTAGIAHEIKNPLNFVNNFAALSAELTGELHEALKPVELAEKLRAEVDELTGLLKDNLEKVVQHGKRADSIVKNMLLHSREGGGEHRPSDINALIDEALNLAYHGARAEKPDFNVTLERDFDAAAGEIGLFPQEITRVLLNLVSNGFYAVTKRKRESGEPDFEPTLRASTKNLGESVEIRIRDNGTGIPPDVKEKMFNPFFTTKPAGEGTGLGLSMSHDIIVKQHGGTIDVDTSPGDFTEFRIVLPRTSNFADKSRG